MELNTTKDLSFYNDQGILTIPAKQYDTGRKFSFRLIADDAPLDVANCRIYLRALKADGTQFQGEECCMIHDGLVTVDTSVSNGDQLLTCAGTNQCEIHLTDNEGKSLTTWTFHIEVAPRVHDGTHIDSIDSWDAWDKMENAVVDIQNKIDSHYFVLTEDKDLPGGVPSLDENAKIPIAELYEATTARQGIVRLTDSVSSDSTSTAATPNSVKQVQEALTAETERAAAADQENAAAIAAETSRATAAEEQIQSVIDTNKPIWDDKYTKAEVDNKFSALETNIDWKESVATYANIAATYPTPQDGWTVNVNDTDYTYRYNGTAWIAISANAIPKATQEIDGLLSAGDKKKLDNCVSKSGDSMNGNLDMNSHKIRSGQKEIDFSCKAFELGMRNQTGGSWNSYMNFDNGTMYLQSDESLKAHTNSGSALNLTGEFELKNGNGDTRIYSSGNTLVVHSQSNARIESNQGAIQVAGNGIQLSGNDNIDINGSKNIRIGAGKDVEISGKGKVYIYPQEEIRLLPGAVNCSDAPIATKYVKTGNIKGVSLADGSRPTITNFDAIHASHFYGTLHGASTSASSATKDSQGNIISDTYATKTEINTLKSSFQAGCDKLSAAITAMGISTASGSSPDVMAGNIAALGSTYGYWYGAMKFLTGDGASGWGVRGAQKIYCVPSGSTVTVTVSMKISESSWRTASGFSPVSNKVIRDNAGWSEINLQNYGFKNSLTVTADSGQSVSISGNTRYITRSVTVQGVGISIGQIAIRESSASTWQSTYYLIIAY